MITAPQIPQLGFHTPSKDKYYHSNRSQNFRSPPQNQRSTFEQLHENNVIQNYILGETIGQGTFNKVKIARHILTNQKVAIKIIDKSSIQTQADRKRLDLELKILRKVRHPNVAQLYEIFQNKKFLFLVTEHVSRGELFQHILKNEKLTEFEACKFLQQLLDAIEYIHSLGVAHRDLKPQNILLDYKFNIKLIDFGLSNIYSKDEFLHTACGSPCYAPPQMLSGKPYNGLKADIWSVGVILYAMCFGYLPFDNPNTKELYKSIKQGRYDIPDHASYQLQSVLSILLQTNPQERATIDQIRGHSFCKFSPLKLTPGIIVGLSDIPYEQDIETQIIEQIYENKHHSEQQKQEYKKKLKYSIKFNKHNQLSATYYLILQRNLKLKNQTLSNYYIKKNNQINRYSIAQKVKQIYDKKLKQRTLNQSRIHSIQKKNKHSKSKPKFAQTHKKQTLNIVELYDRNKKKQHLDKDRRLKTTNTKRRKDQNQADKIFKKTKLNFNQIQLSQKKNKRITPNKLKDKSFDKNKPQRPRNKSIVVPNRYQKISLTNPNHRKSPHKTYENSPGKKHLKSPEKHQNPNKKTVEFSSRKKRSQSQNTFYHKSTKFTVQNRNTLKRLQRKDNIKNDDRVKQKSPQKSSHKKLKAKINTHLVS